MRRSKSKVIYRNSSRLKTGSHLQQQEFELLACISAASNYNFSQSMSKQVGKSKGLRKMTGPVDPTISEEILDTVVERLVALASPVRIILFGSTARGEAQPQSDLDLLIVEKEVAEPYDETLRLDRALRDLMLPLDLIVVSEDQLNRYGRVPGTVYYRSLKEGRGLYAQ